MNIRLKPFQGRVIGLGDVSAVAYYTVEHDGFRVVLYARPAKFRGQAAKPNATTAPVHKEATMASTTQSSDGSTNAIAQCKGSETRMEGKARSVFPVVITAIILFCRERGVDVLQYRLAE